MRGTYKGGKDSVFAIMISILENTDLDLTVLIDFESEVDCDFEDCSNPADYIIWYMPCHCEEIKACDPCVSSKLRRVKNGIGIRCNFCSVKVETLGKRPV